MSVKVFQTNSNGKIEFTRAELEKLLNDTYKEGHRDGENKANNSYWTWVSPTLANSPAITYANTNTNTNTGAIRTTPDSITVTCTDAKVNEDALNKLAGMESKSTAAPKITANVSVNGAKGQVYDLSSLAKEIDQILFGVPTPAGSCGTFAKPKNEYNANLAKELRNV